MNKTRKRCGHCEAVKPYSEFHRNILRRDGYQNFCKSCARGSRVKYEAGNKDKISQRRKEYKNSEQGRSTVEKYVATARAKLLRAKRDKKRLMNNPEKNRARTAVNLAVKNGKLPSAKNLICSNCRNKQAQQYHHYLGYAKENQLNVVPVCRECHGLIHNYR